MGLTRPRAYQIFDIDYKQSVRVVTVSNVTLGGGAPSLVDGVSLSLNDRVLVTAQSTGSQNGLYYVTTVGTGSNGTWARSIDGNETGEIDAGMIVMVTEGTTYADTQWKLTTNDPIVIGSTALTFVQNYSANSISSGTSNVTVASNANVSIAVAGSNVAVFTSGGPHQFTGNLNPTSNITYSLGNASSRWKDIYLANSSIYLGNVTLSADATQLLVNGSNVVTSTGGAMTLTGNITGGNLITSGLVSATGNINTTGTLNINSTSGNYNVLNISGTALAPYGTPQTWKFFTNNTALGGAASFILFPDSSTQTTAYPGTASALSLSANITGGNLISNAAITASGNITGSYFIGNGYTITSVNASNVSGTVANATYATSAGSATSATTAGTVTTAAQPNITSVGTLSSLTVTANVTGGNLITGGLISATGNITGGNLSGTSIVGTLTTAAQTNITSVGTLGSLAVTGNITAGNVTGVANVNATTHTGTTVSVTGNVTGGNLVTGGAVSATGAVSGSLLYSLQSLVNEGGEISLALPSSGSTLVGNVIIDVYQNRIRFFEGGGTARGAYIDLTAAAAGAGTNLLAGAGGTPGGSNTYVQFNDAGSFGGNGQFVYDKVTNTLTAGIIAANNNGAGTNFKVGDDAWIGDVNTADTMSIRGQQNAANGYIVFGNADVTGKLGRAGTGPLTYAGAFTATGNITGSYFIGNGYTITSINASNVSGTVANATYATSAGSATTATTAGTVTTAAQPNITSVGTLSSLTVTGNVTGGNILTAGQLISSVATGTAPMVITSTTKVTNLNVEQVDGYHADTANTVSTIAVRDASANIVANYYTGVGANVTGNITGGNLTTAGKVTAVGNISGNYFIGNGSQLTGISGGTTIGGNLVVLSRSGNVNFAITAGYLIVNTRASGNVSIAISA